MAEGARLESVYTATYRGFESPPHRHILRRARTTVRAFFSHVAHLRGDEKPRPGFDYWRSQLDRPGAQRTGCPAGASKASQSPPHRHILRRARTKVRAFFSHVAFAGCGASALSSLHCYSPAYLRRPDKRSAIRHGSYCRLSSVSTS